MDYFCKGCLYDQATIQPPGRAVDQYFFSWYDFILSHSNGGLDDICHSLFPDNDDNLFRLVMQEIEIKLGREYTEKLEAVRWISSTAARFAAAGGSLHHHRSALQARLCLWL